MRNAKLHGSVERGIFSIWLRGVNSCRGCRMPRATVFAAKLLPLCGGVCVSALKETFPCIALFLG
jgi:hypothetical protein